MRLSGVQLLLPAPKQTGENGYSSRVHIPTYCGSSPHPGKLMDFIMIRKCKHHGETEFAQNGKKSWYCLKCHGLRQRKRRISRKERAIQYKGGCCAICGYNKCNDALDFHHMDPSTKLAEIGSRDLSWKILSEELDKCILVCANCHREIHSINH